MTTSVYLFYHVTFQCAQTHPWTHFQLGFSRVTFWVTYSVL